MANRWPLFQAALDPHEEAERAADARFEEETAEARAVWNAVWMPAEERRKTARAPHERATEVILAAFDNDEPAPPEGV